jgi:hypothetical protein
MERTKCGRLYKKKARKAWEEERCDGRLGIKKDVVVEALERRKLTKA